MRTSILGRFITVMTAGCLGVGMLMGMVGHAQAASPASNGASVLMKEAWEADNGRIGGWWTGAVALSTVMTYQQTTGDKQYAYAMSEAFAKNKNFTNDYIDDTGWWALVWLQAYDITGNQDYLNMAKTTTNYMHNYWDDKCGGGVYWSTAKEYKASIANELYLAATAGLHNRIAGDTQYRDWANAEWNWFKGSGLIQKSNQVGDGINVKDCSFNNAALTYNQGVVLQGLVELSRANGDAGLLTTATTMATATLKYKTKNGVLYEGCEPNCSKDFDAFKGVFMRYLRSLVTATKTTQFDSFLQTTASSIIANDTNSAGELGQSWVGPYGAHTNETQAAALAALVAALPLPSLPPVVSPPPSTPPVTGTPAPTPPVTATPAPPVTGTPPAGGTPPVTGTTATIKGHESGRCVDVLNRISTSGSRPGLWDCNGGTNQNWTATATHQLTSLGKCLDATSAGTANGTAVQIWDCNGGTNQQWTVKSDGTIVGVGSGKCLDATGHGTADGTRLVIWTCTGGANQEWSQTLEQS